VIEKIIEGKLGSFYEQVVLPDQASIRDPKVAVRQVIATAAKALGGDPGWSASRACASASPPSRRVPLSRGWRARRRVHPRRVRGQAGPRQRGRHIR